MASNRISDSNNIQNQNNQFTQQTLANGQQVNAHAFNSADNAATSQINSLTRGQANAQTADAIAEAQAQLQLQKQARQLLSAGI